MLSRLFRRPLLLLALALPWSLPTAASEEAALARAIEAIQPDAIRADLTFIASDELAGRDTPSLGLRIAARYIRARLQRLHFRPAGDDGGFFAHYTLQRVQMDTQASRATVVRPTGELELELLSDYAFFPDGFANLRVEAPVRWAGHGDASELEGIDLKGAWALVVSSEEVPWRTRIATAREHGAVGVLTLPDPSQKREGVIRFARRMMERPGLRKAVEAEVFPVVYLSRAGAAKLELGAPPALGGDCGFRFRDERLIRDEAVHELENVAALWPGTDLADEVLIVSAHYDHVGERDGQIWNGADDNGSGTCGLLALADALAEYGPLRRSVLLLWVSGEEKGLLGSDAWTRRPTLPEGMHPVLDLNIDMIGRNAPDKLLITPSEDHPAFNGLSRLAEDLAPLEGFPSLGSADAYWRRSDHMNFADNLGIPVAFLFSDVHEDYHQPTDTVDKIDFDKIRRVTRLVLRMLDALQGDHLDLRLAGGH